MKSSHLLQSYEFLVDRADAAFREVEKQYGDCLKCGLHCSDCCHAFFGLFLIEAAFLKSRFDQLVPREIQKALLRCNDTERALKRMEIRLQKAQEDPRMQSHILATERIRCPLLNEEEECVLYESRPITCRVYGIPTKVNGRGRVCGKNGFQNGESYPVFDLDGTYRELFALSKKLLEDLDQGSPENAALLISVPRAVSTPLDLLVNESFG